MAICFCDLFQLAREHVDVESSVHSQIIFTIEPHLVKILQTVKIVTVKQHLDILLASRTGRVEVLFVFFCALAKPNLPSLIPLDLTRALDKLNVPSNKSFGISRLCTYEVVDHEGDPKVFLVKSEGSFITTFVFSPCVGLGRVVHAFLSLTAFHTSGLGTLSSILVPYLQYPAL